MIATGKLLDIGVADLFFVVSTGDCKSGMKSTGDLISANAGTGGGRIFSETLGRGSRRKNRRGAIARRETDLSRGGCAGDRAPARSAETAALKSARQADALRVFGRQLDRDSPRDEREAPNRGREILPDQT